MNSQIEELLAQTGLTTVVNGRPYPVSMSAEESQAAYIRFAELIVRKCSDVVSNVPFGYSDYRSQIEAAMRDDCASAVLNHFGMNTES